jgi:hypothetical protein
VESGSWVAVGDGLVFATFAGNVSGGGNVSVGSGVESSTDLLAESTRVLVLADVGGASSAGSTVWKLHASAARANMITIKVNLRNAAVFLYIETPYCVDSL